MDTLIDLDSRRDVSYVYLITQAYNASLKDLYLTHRNEKMEFSEEQLVEIAFQVLKAI